MLSIPGKGGLFVYSEEYEAAKKEFVNCLWMSIIGVGVPIVIAFKEWYPIMRREKRKALESAAAKGGN